MHPTERVSATSCHIRLWHGYIKKQFYAESSDRDFWVAKSPFFRVEKGIRLEDSAQAAEAFTQLLDALVADGWEIADRRAESWDVTLSRGGKRSASRQPVDR